MYRLLVPVDIDKTRARAQVDTILDMPYPADSIHVDVLHTFEQIDLPTEEAGEGFIDELHRDITDIREPPQAVDTAITGLRDAGVDVTFYSVTGEPAHAILKTADELDVDALVLGVRRRSPVGKVLFGSVLQAVILDSERPVIIAPT